MKFEKMNDPGAFRSPWTGFLSNSSKVCSATLNSSGSARPLIVRGRPKIIKGFRVSGKIRAESRLLPVELGLHLCAKLTYKIEVELDVKLKSNWT